MKSLRERSTRTQELPGGWLKSIVHGTWILLLPMLIVACGGSLGKIRVENVDSVITQSEAAIQQARLANAEALAPDTLRGAEISLQDAKEAVKAKKGVEAMRLAYEALTQAQNAEQEAMYKSQEAGLNAIIQRKEAENLERQTNLQKAEAKVETIRTEIQQLETQKSQLQSEYERQIHQLRRELALAQSMAEETRKSITDIESLKAELDAKETQIHEAQRKAGEYERQIRQLRRELALAQSMAEEAQKEAEATRQKAAAQAKNYSKQIDHLDESRVLKQREDWLDYKKQEARAFVRRQEEPRTHKTLLTEVQVAQGKAVLNDWYLAWAAKDIAQHLADYAPDVVAEQIIIRANSEQRTSMNRTQLVDTIRRKTGEQWGKADVGFEAEGDNVIGTYRFSRMVQNAGDGNRPALYNVWTREVWAHPINNQWKIFREVWRIYENVPKYANRFNQ
jgi:ketosteroid isomerase-like protein